MDIWTPVRAHAEWIALFRETLYGRNALQTHLIGRADACDVGRWLEQERPTLGHLREFRIAEDIHERFHARAGYCLRLAQSGHKAEAFADTEMGGQLRRLSQRLVIAFQDLKRTVRQQQLPVSWRIGPPRPWPQGVTAD